MVEHLFPLDHLAVTGHVRDTEYRATGGSIKRQTVDRLVHGSRLLNETENTFMDADAARRAAEIDEQLRAVGVQIVLEGTVAFPIPLERLTSSKGGEKKWELLSVSNREVDGEVIERIAVWVSDAHRAEFMALFESYLTEDTPGGNPRNAALIANINRVRRATLADLWTSEDEPPKHGWWEVWLTKDVTTMRLLREFTEPQGIRVLNRQFSWLDHWVVWIEATQMQITHLLFTKVPVLELRKPEFIDTVEDLSPEEQAELVTDLGARVQASTNDSDPAVCLLDTGVLRGHILLRDSLAPEDWHSIFPNDGYDVRGHGTAMAGLALYGDIDHLLVSSTPVTLHHRLESVRMQPGKGEAELDPVDYGSATAQATALPQISAPQRPRLYCLTLSCEPDFPGEPTLWSAAIDALAIGTDSAPSERGIRLLDSPTPAEAKLFVIAAGNTGRTRQELDFRALCELSPIESPAQSWNALTVAAYTDKTDLPTDPQFTGYSAMAAQGELSPHSCTSVLFDHKKWPIKPDICLEGGNILTDGGQMFETCHPIVSVRTTGNNSDQAITSANATSAASAQAARLGALAMSRYPSY